MNFDHLDEIIEYFNMIYGIKRFKFSQLINEGNAALNGLNSIEIGEYNGTIENLKLMYPDLSINRDEINEYTKGEYNFEEQKFEEKVSCNAFKHHLTITPEEYIIPCGFFYKDKYLNGINLVEALELDKKSIEDKYIEFNKAKKEQMKDGCIQCSLSNICNVNCPYVILENDLNFSSYCIKSYDVIEKKEKIEATYNKLIKSLSSVLYSADKFPSIRFVQSNGQEFTHDYVSNSICVDLNIMNFEQEEVDRILNHELEHHMQSQKYDIGKLFKYTENQLPNGLEYNAGMILNITLDILADSQLELPIDYETRKTMKKEYLKKIAKYRFIYFILYTLILDNNYMDKYRGVNKPKEIIDVLIEDFTVYRQVN